MTTATEHTPSGSADLERALAAERKASVYLRDRNARLIALIRTLDADRVIANATIARLEAENAALLLRESELPY